MNFHEIKTEIRQISLIDERYRFIADKLENKIIISMYEYKNGYFSKKKKILKIDSKNFEFEIEFKGIKNMTIKSLLVHLACRSCGIGVMEVKNGINKRSCWDNV